MNEKEMFLRIKLGEVDYIEYKRLEGEEDEEHGAAYRMVRWRPDPRASNVDFHRENTNT